MGSSPNLAGLVIKEPTPSIAPSIYESLQYTKKWRILLALGIGLALIGICILVFYLTAESKRPKGPGDILKHRDKSAILPVDADVTRWRTQKENICLANKREACNKDFGEFPIILLVLGGLRTDQLQDVPALTEFTRCGAKAASLVPVYPSFQYPNLYSIATGLYPASHGIVSKEMYDERLAMNFSTTSSNSKNPRWWKGEPIWNTMNKTNVKSAAYLWPGSDIAIGGMKPTYIEQEDVDFRIRIRRILDWIQWPKAKRPQLIMLNYNEPAKKAKQFGPFSPRTTEELKKINEGLDELMASLQRLHIFNCVDVIVTSDRGVAASHCRKTVYLDEIIDEKIPGRIYTGPVGRIDFFKDVRQNTKDRILKKLQCNNPSLIALTKKEIPKRYHYTKSSRIGDVILDSKSRTRIATQRNSQCSEGEAGFNNLFRSMQGIFVAHGPRFKQGITTKSFRNIEIYNLLSYMLKLPPAPNNGTNGSLIHLLKDSNTIFLMNNFTTPRKPLAEVIKEMPNRPNKATLNTASQSCSCQYLETTTTSTTTTTTPPPPSTTATTPTTSPATTKITSTTSEPSSTSKAKSLLLVEQKENSTADIPVAVVENIEAEILEPQTDVNENKNKTEIASNEQNSNPSSYSTKSSELTQKTPEVVAKEVENLEIPLAKSISSQETNNYNSTLPNSISSTTPKTSEEKATSQPEDKNETSVDVEEMPTEDDFIDKEVEIIQPVKENTTKTEDLSKTTNNSSSAETNVTEQSNIAKISNNATEETPIEIIPIPESLKSMSLVKELSDEEKIKQKELIKKHCPWGVPSFSPLEVSSDVYNILPHSSHIIGLPESLGLGLWTSFTLGQKTILEVKRQRFVDGKGITMPRIPCWISDPRLSQSSQDQCSKILQTELYSAKNVSLRQLYPYELERPETLDREGFLLSNLCPMRKGFEKSGREAMLKAIEKWGQNEGIVNVVHGPVFDYDLDGKMDSLKVIRNTNPLVASDFFYVVTTCNMTQTDEAPSTTPSFNACSSQQLKVFAFVFPNTDREKCFMTDREYLQYYLASVADIENLTSLRFFAKMPQKEYLSLRAQQPIKILPF